MSKQDHYNIPIHELSSFKNQGKIPHLIDFHSLDALRTFIKEGKPFFILGKGSNTLIHPHHSYDCIIRISPQMSEPHIHNGLCRLNAGLSVNKLMNLSQKFALSGLEFTAGVPASLGGMICMNFGCWGQEIADRVHRVHILDEKGDAHWLTKDDMQFGYRHSIIQTQNNWIIIEAELKLSPDQTEQIHDRIQENIQERLEKQPLRTPSFGCIFKNPSPLYAGKIIEDLGYKGMIKNAAGVSEKHCNFMINTGQASFEDALNVIHTIQKEAQDKLGIQLEPEVQLCQ